MIGKSVPDDEKCDVERRRDSALQRALNTPPKPHGAKKAAKKTLPALSRKPKAKP